MRKDKGTEMEGERERERDGGEERERWRGRERETGQNGMRGGNVKHGRVGSPLQKVLNARRLAQVTGYESVVGG